MPEAAAAQETTVRPLLKSRGRQVAVCLASIFILLSLISYRVEDVAKVSGGAEALHHLNWMGSFGARFSYWMVLAFGLAAWPAALLFSACLLRRAFGSLPPANGFYLSGLVLSVLGLVTVLGCFPDFLPAQCRALNLKECPGGAVGSFFSNPGSGILYYCLNDVGCVILGTVLSLFGMATIWLYDWRVSFNRWQEERGHQQPVSSQQQPASGAAAPPPVSRIRKSASTVMSWLKVVPGKKIEGQEVQTPALAPAAAKKESFAPAIASRHDSAGAIGAIDSSHALGRHDSGSALSDDASRFLPPAPPRQVEARKPQILDAKPHHEAVFTPPPLPPPPRSLAPPPPGKPAYTLPGTELLSRIDEKTTVDEHEVMRKKAILHDVMRNFKIACEMGEAIVGPRVTLFEIFPEKTVRVESIGNLEKNIAMELQAVAIRTLLPIPGRRSVGVEVPNDHASAVCFRSLIEHRDFQDSKAMMPVVLGKDVAGKAEILDLAKAPHLLVAGATGAGKSVFMNTLIMSLVLRFSPDELELIMIDPKQVEFAAYRELPHLVTPVITDPKHAPSALRWAVFEMERRYQILAKVGVKNLESFNGRVIRAGEPKEDDFGNPIPPRLPMTVIIIDELADLMMSAKAEIEGSIARIAQKARAVGIHLVIATQTPRKEVLTGVIKANFPTRVAFKVSQQVDSRVILDRSGADELLGKGDMLYVPPGASNLTRIQGAYVPDSDIEAVVAACAVQRQPQFKDILKSVEVEPDGEAPPAVQGEFELPGAEGDDDGSLLKKAIDCIRRDRKASTSYLQRRLGIGYNRAADLMDELEENGYVTPKTSAGQRDINWERFDDDRSQA
ncbi:MAG: hypothetical protein RL095_1107 [Verrucomicrobiota bacterium]|jgi:S-DNA-T family DNA segregation ATPase FtsK/SpoIIIE